MRIDPIPHDSGATSPPTAAPEQPGVTRIITELEAAGLLSVEVDESGDVSFALTRSGRRTASLMAMSRDGHALVLLSGLVGAEHGPN